MTTTPSFSTESAVERSISRPLSSLIKHTDGRPSARVPQLESMRGSVNCISRLRSIESYSSRAFGIRDIREASSHHRLAGFGTCGRKGRKEGRLGSRSRIRCVALVRESRRDWGSRTVVPSVSVVVIATRCGRTAAFSQVEPIVQMADARIEKTWSPLLCYSWL